MKAKNRVADISLSCAVIALRRVLGASGVPYSRSGAIRLVAGSRADGAPWAIVQVVEDGGATIPLIRAITANELTDKIYSFIDGHEYARRNGPSHVFAAHRAK